MEPHDKNLQRDFYPPEMRFRKWMFSRLRSSVEQFGFEEMDAPILEPIELYLAKTSEEIFSTQIYTFKDGETADG